MGFVFGTSFKRTDLRKLDGILNEKRPKELDKSFDLFVHNEFEVNVKVTVSNGHTIYGIINTFRNKIINTFRCHEF